MLKQSSESTAQRDEKSSQPVRSLVRVVPLYVFILLLTVSAGVWFGFRRYIAVDGQLVVDPDDLSFGDVWLQRDFKKTVRLHNDAAHDLEVIDVRPSCSCVAVEPKQFIVPARGSAELTFTIDLIANSEDDDVEHVREFGEQFSVMTQPGVRKYQIWTLSGRVRSAFRVTPSELRFPDLRRGAEFASQSVRITPYVALKELRADCDASKGRVEVHRGAREDSEFVVQVVSSPSLPIGRFELPISLIGVMPSGETLPPIVVQAIGRVTSNFLAIPASIDWGIVERGQHCKTIVTVQTQDERTFRITGVNKEGRIEVRTASTELAKTQTVEVAAQFEISGHHETNIQVQVETPDGHSEAISVPVRCYVMEESP